MSEKSFAPSTTEQLQGFEAFVEDVMQDWRLPGLAIAILKENDVILQQGFGKRSVEEDLDITPNTLFPIASCTKAFTATSLAMLVDEGKLDWDTPIRTYLPAFKLRDNVASERTTARDLLSHRTGLPRHDLIWYATKSTRDELFARLQYLEPSKDFRSTWQYQNLMYMVAGYLLETISGLTWEEFVQQRIFDPLGMTASTFTIEDIKKTTDYAMPHKKVKDEAKLTEFFEGKWSVASAGAINSSVVDMSKWLRFLLNKGKHDEQQLITETQLAQTMTPLIVIPEPRKYTETNYTSYALGWSVTSYRGHLMLSHTGGIDGFSALTILLPDDKIGMSLLTNRGGCPAHWIAAYNAIERLMGLNETPWNERYKKEVAEMESKNKKQEDKEKRILDTQPSHTPLSAYTGTFEDPGYGQLRIEQNGEGLRLTYGKLNFRLEHFHYDIFNALGDPPEDEDEPGLKVSFLTSHKGTIDSISIDLGNDPSLSPIVFKRVETHTVA